MPHRIARSAASTYRKALLQLIGKIGMQLHAVHGRRGEGERGVRGTGAHVSGGVLACGQNPAVSALSRSIGKLSKGLPMHTNRFISWEKNNWAWESQGDDGNTTLWGGVGAGVLKKGLHAWLRDWSLHCDIRCMRCSFFGGTYLGVSFNCIWCCCIWWTVDWYAYRYPAIW